MTQEQIEFVREHENLFINQNTISVEQKKTIYDIYNFITGENKKPTGCGRCVASVLKMVHFTYKKYTRHEN